MRSLMLSILIGAMTFISSARAITITIYSATSLLLCWSSIAADALMAVDDSAATLPDTPIVIPVLMNDAVSTGNSTAILRVTQPAHGRVIRNSTPTSHAELTPLFQFAARQLSNTLVQVAIPDLYPWYLANGVWRSIPTNTAVNFDQNWIGGFFPGSLWMIYEQTGDPNFSHWAQMWQAALAPEQYSTAKDDVGFLINSSFGNGYRITGNPQYKDILTQTRRSFTNRWNSIVGCLADDRLLTPPLFEVIVDTMMNTEIFFRADLDQDTNMLAMAISHAGRTLANHLRADGSTFMRVIYDGVTNGSVLLKDNRVPIGPMDTWARGQAWATHAFPLLYGATGDGRFLETAKKVADFYISHAPADYVPYWYYPSGGMDTTLLRDSSAAAVTLSGLLDLSQLVTNDADGAKYWLAAHRLFASLSSTSYLAVNTTNAILLHANPVDANTDTSLIYADYYFIESLKRFNDLYNQTTLTYIPAANFTGSDSFTYQACDSSGAVSTATVTLEIGAYEYSMTYSRWAQECFAAADLADPGKETSVWGCDADPDHDGRVNLLEYALGSDPSSNANVTDSNEIEIASVGSEPAYLHVRFPRRLDDATLEYVVEVSADLQVWNYGTAYLREVARSSVPGNPHLEWVEFEDLTAVASAQPRFIRVRVVPHSS